MQQEAEAGRRRLHPQTDIGQGGFSEDSGSQLPHIVFTSPNIIFVAGTQKIVPNLDEALKRLREYVLPLEDKRMKDVGMGGSAISKLLIFEREQPFMKRKIRIILVGEKLGF